jgi:predicted N-acetyltransferase YhbS
MRELVAAEGALLDRILDATHEIWHEGLDRAAYGKYFAAQLATPWGRKRLRRVALVEGGEVLASAKLYDFEAALDGRPLRVTGVGAVFTQPRHRGQGAASELMSRLLETARTAGADAALLFSEIGPGFYARFGFERIATCDLTIRVAKPERRGAPAMMVRAGEERDLAGMVTMDAARGARFRWRLIRDRHLVHYAIAKRRLLAGLGSPGARELQFFVAEEGGSAVAYVVISVRGGPAPHWVIDSCGDRDPGGARLGALLQLLIARDPGAARPAIAAWLPSGFCPPQMAIVERAASRDVMMMKPLSNAARADPPLTAADVFYWVADTF